MNSSQLFARRAFLFEEQPVSDDKISSIIQKILSESKQDNIIHSIKTLKSNENYDSYIVESGYEPNLNQFEIKLSLDKNNPTLISESSFLKENEDIFCDKYIHSSILSDKSNIRYLVTKREKYTRLHEEGRYFLIDNLDLLIFTIIFFSGSICKRTFKQYQEIFFEEKCFSNSSEYLKEILDANYDYDLICQCFESLKNESKINYDQSLIERDTVCHGGLGLDTIVITEDSIKFKDCFKTFKGNKLLDIVFLCLDLGLDKKNINLIIKRYCAALSLNKKEIKKEFKSLMNIASPMFFCELLHSFLIESTVFLNRREGKLFEYIEKFSRSYVFFEDLKIDNKLKEFIRALFVQPMLSSHAEAEKIPIEILTKDRATKNKKQTKPELNVKLSLKENGKKYLKIKWSKTKNKNKYLCYIKKPNGEYKIFKKSKINSLEFDDLNLLGCYGIGVRVEESDVFEASDFNIKTIEITDI